MQTIVFRCSFPNRDAYLDILCGSAADALNILDKAEWAKVKTGSVRKVRDAGPHSVDVYTPKRAQAGTLVTITAG